MITQIIEKWEQNKSKLEQYFRNTKQSEYDSYEAILIKIFELCINTSTKYWENFNIHNLTVIDNGDYQGTQIFIIPKDTYQPSVSEYIYTNTYYGSCSGCDTLLGISDYDYDEKPNEEQISQYMTLSLHLVQKMKWLAKDE